MKSLQIRHSIMLLITAMIWGVAFVAQSEGGDAVGPYSFNCIRSRIGGVVLIPVIMIFDRTKITKNKPVNREERKRLLTGGMLCGIVLALASILQQLGLFYGTSAGKAGFLTACYILLVPILGIFLKKKCGLNIWVGVIMAFVGLYLLCINGKMSLKLCDMLVLGCSFLFSIQIMLVDHYAPIVDCVRMSCIQFFTAGIVSAIPMFLVEMNHNIGGVVDNLGNLNSLDAWIPILYAGVMSSGVAYTMQTVAQNGVHPTIASLIMSLESVFSVIAGWIILNEHLSEREILGCVIMFAAIIIAQLPLKKLGKK